jgi:hypothetical protein
LSKDTDERVKRYGLNNSINFTKERKELLSKERIGEKNPNWKGGFIESPYPKEFNRRLKNLIKQRDNYTCQLCNSNKEQLKCLLVVHHIDYNKENNKRENLLTLCSVCHSKTNYNRESWLNYFKNRLVQE